MARLFFGFVSLVCITSFGVCIYACRIDNPGLIKLTALVAAVTFALLILLRMFGMDKSHPRRGPWHSGGPYH
jgi:hypothetical protein